jgi:effector-binding domain-containing protein
VNEPVVEIVEFPGAQTAVVKALTTWEAFPDLWPVLLDEVWTFVRANSLEAGRNVMLVKDDRPRVEVGVELAAPFASDGRVVASTLPSGRAVRTVAVGPLSPEGIAAAHARAKEWAAGNGVELDRMRWEVYGHWADDQDPDVYEIEVYWRVRDVS